MQIKESIIMAFSAIRANKLRSILTLLGIAVGVFSIIAVMTSMRVMQNSIESGLTVLGAHTFQIQKFPAIQMGHTDWRKYRQRRDIDYEQARLVTERATLARAVGVSAWFGGRIIRSESEQTNPNVGVTGMNPEGISTRSWNVDEGRFITDQEVEYARNVAVLGKRVAEKLFPYTYPIGREIRIEGDRFQVIGILEERGSFLGSEQDNFVVIPITAFFKLYGKERSLGISVQAQSVDTYQEAIEQVRGILRIARRVPPGAPDDFEIVSNDSLIAEFNKLTFLIRAGIGFISFIALLAAGVGIMNIMLVSVTERTREIGIRKAVGARKKNIMSQFVLEAIALCQIGGIAGIALGLIGGNVLAVMLSIPPVFPYDWAAIGLLICSVVGIVFGVYPAWKAANLDPIDALRYE
jgi:putative ABC transport system permease protein